MFERNVGTRQFKHYVVGEHELEVESPKVSPNVEQT